MGFQDHDGPMTVEKMADGVYLFRPATPEELADALAERAELATAPTPADDADADTDGGPRC